MVDGLFGPQPAERVRGRGRPAHVWNRQNSVRICNLFACGHAVETVAAVIGLSQPTLRKVYFSEVQQRDHMALKVKADQLARLTERAIGGNVTAEKALAEMIQAEQQRLLGDHVRDRGRRPAMSAPQGKKEQARDAAHNVRGRFAPREAPPSLLN
ncbi:MAG: hypothetical protein EBR82_17295 [Caulobacteraceae bacterium]|nr:hypothetical protein [Caulobacteraceae bacterium]